MEQCYLVALFMHQSATGMQNTPFLKAICRPQENAGYGIQLARPASNSLLGIAGNCNITCLLERT